MNFDKSLDFEVDSIWNIFEYILKNFKTESKSEEFDPFLDLDKLIHLTNKTEERKRILFALYKAFTEKSFKVFKRYLKIFNLEHLRDKIILLFIGPGEICYREGTKGIEILACARNREELMNKISTLFERGIIKEGEVLYYKNI